LTGREFRAIRLRLGLTQEDLAMRLGVIRVTVTRWETGKLRVPKIAALAIRQLAYQEGVGVEERKG
jgi:transcriptional regulator with XRE-family HTH domain